MKAIEVFRKVYDEKSCHLVRPRKNCPNEYDAKHTFTGNKRGWAYVDLILTVHKACNDQQKAKFKSLGLIGMVNFAWKCIK
jgi:hypothetical protein